MIDTDKYEGHTPAPWNVEHGDMERYGETDTVVAKDDYQVAEGVMRQDAQLIADAPLLLEEVKRLRGLLDTIIDITLKELKIFDDNCPMINIRDLAYKGILWGSKND